MLIVKKHVNKNRLILAVCDKTLLNKKIENKEIILDLTSDFYKGESVDNKEFLELIKRAYILNVVGESAISLLVKAKIINKANVKKVKDTPYAQIVFED